MGAFNKRSGQTIIEAMIALSTILVIMASISIAMTSSLNNSQFIKNQSLASKYAKEGMETLRYTRNNDPVTFNAYSGSYCMDSVDVLSSAGGGGCTVNIPSASLIRQVDFVNDAGGCSGGKQVTVTVYWASGKCSSATLSTRYCHKSQIISCLSKESTSGTSL